MPMMSIISDDPLIPFKGGFVVRASTAIWFIEASWRLTFAVAPDGRLKVSPRQAVTDADDRFIRVASR